jgi:hypothetical protein
MEDLLKELADALEDALDFIDGEGPYELFGNGYGEEANERREEVMERAADILSCYRYVDYEVVDGEVVWPEKETNDRVITGVTQE